MRKPLLGLTLGCVLGLLFAAAWPTGAQSLPQMLGFGRTAGGVNVPLLVDSQGRLATSGGGGGFSVPAGWTWTAPALAAPSTGVITGALTPPQNLVMEDDTSSGNSLPAGNYYIKVVAIDPVGGVTTASNEVLGVVPIENDGIGYIQINWDQIPGLTGSSYRIYYGSTPGGQTHYVTNASQGGYLDPTYLTDISTAIAGTPPSTSTALVFNAPDWWLAPTLYGPTLNTPTVAGKLTGSNTVTPTAAWDGGDPVIGATIDATVNPDITSHAGGSIQGLAVGANYNASGNVVGMTGLSGGIAFNPADGTSSLVQGIGLNILNSSTTTGTIANNYGAFIYDTFGNGTIGNNTGVWIRAAIATGTITTNWGVGIASPSSISSGTIGTNVGLYVADQANAGITNSYYSWDDSRGVRRVKEDSTFDSVGQAIEALYNPQFTKYVAGATDYERVVLGQFNANVAEIGTEKGGSGTLRNLRLIGSGLQFGSTLVAPANSGTRYLCISTAGVITSSSSACSGT